MQPSSLISLPRDRAQHIEAAANSPASRWSPGWDEAWWWLWIPIAATLAIVATSKAAPEFYSAWILPEGYGVLELSQFLMALAGFCIAVRLLFSACVRGWGLLLAATALFAVACLFIAGEEHSWGQHFFHWSTPDYWAAINRQQETNLHNSFRSLNHLPQFILEVGILVGGILMPLWQRFAGPFTDPLLKLFVPPMALLPTALCALAFKVIKRLSDRADGLDIIIRPSEAMEVFFYLFILGYLVVYARRVAALELQSASNVR